MTWTTADIPDLSGRTAVVTGANGGLGLEVARELARAGAHVVMAARDQDKAARARADILDDVPGARLSLHPLDLASLTSVADAGRTITEAHPRLDLLVNNAGVMAIPERATVDGFEMQLGTNHLGHFVLTALLMPALLHGDAARVVSVTSTARHFGRQVDPANPHLHGTYSPWRSYGQSKLANLHFAVALQRRLGAAGARAQSLVAHPGYSHTDLQARSTRETQGASQRFFATAVTWVGMPAARGALPLLRAATDPAARGGELYAPRYVNFGPPVRRPLVGRSLDEKAMSTLWTVSEQETSRVFDVAALVAEAQRAE